MIKNNACEDLKCSRQFSTNLTTTIIRREGDDDDDDGGYDYAPAAWVMTIVYIVFLFTFLKVNREISRKIGFHFSQVNQYIVTQDLYI